MVSKCTVIESQADWLTATCQHNGDELAFLRLGETLVDREHTSGNKRSGFRTLGYRGSHAGRASYGCRGDGSIITLSGDLAAIAFDGVCDLATHISRIDIAVTAVLDPPIRDIESDAFDEACAWQGIGGHPPEVELRRYRDGTAALRLGKRTSDRFMRMYNKAAESGEARYYGAHRYEVETKGGQATTVARALRVESARPAFCASFVHAHCTDRGIVPVFLASERVNLLPGFRRRSDTDASLDWLTRAVRPTVSRVLAQGRTNDLLSALGFGADTRIGLLGKGEKGVDW